MDINPKIELKNFSLEFPIFNASSRSITSRLLSVASGGRLDAESGRFVNVTALHEVSFKAEVGDRIALLGHNGSGKSTLLRALFGIYKPTGGEIAVQGTTASLIDLSLGINPEASGRENIFIRAALMGLPRKYMLEKFSDVVEFSELGNFIDLPVRTYSSGMLLRLAFAVSTIVKPEILLMDEWLSVGDEKFRHKAEKRLEDMIGATKILVIATHSRELVEKVCNRVIWLEHGQVKMDGSVSEVLSAYFG